jgi:hypothetical protein
MHSALIYENNPHKVIKTQLCIMCVYFYVEADSPQNNNGHKEDISAISWRSVLLVKETGFLGEKPLTCRKSPKKCII